MRRWILTLLFMVLLFPALPATAAAPPRVEINGQELVVPAGQEPFIEEGRTLIPLRAIFEALGAKVSWDGETGTVTAVKGKVAVLIQIGSYIGWVGDTRVGLDVPPRIVEGRTYVPLRFVSESFGATVAWDAATRTISIAATVEPPGLPVERAVASPVTHVTYAPGAAMEPAEVGIYWMKVGTGAVEGWTIPTAADGSVIALLPSPDNQYLQIRAGSRAYLVVRATGEIFQWDRTEIELVAAHRDRMLWVQGDGAFFITDAAFSILTRFKAGKVAESWQDQALFDVDGRRIALLTSDGLFLVDVPVGTAKRIGEGGTRLRYVGPGGRFAVEPLNGNGALRQYTWQGTLFSEHPRWWGFLSPDGFTFAHAELEAGFLPVVYLTKVGETQPTARIIDASTCYGFGTPNHWASFGSDLLINTRQGIRMLSNGQLSSVPGLRPGWAANPVPDPSGGSLIFNTTWDSSLDLQVLEVLDRSGQQLGAVSIRRSTPWITLARHVDPWGLNISGRAPAEVRFGTSYGGTGGPCGDFGPVLEPKIQTPPFPATLTMAVKGTGDCLNLRSTPALSGEAVACLKDGARLTVKAPATGKEGAWWQDGHLWVHVEMDDGTVGWVAVTSGYLAWAD